MLPCEKMAKYYIPALRVSIAKDLSKLGKTQTEIAHVLGISQAAVNKYLSGNYSIDIKKMEKDSGINKLAMNVSTRIKKENLDHISTGKLMMESCGTLSGCGVKHD